MVDFMLVSVSLASFSIIIAVYYYTLSVGNTKRNIQANLETRRAQLFSELNSRLTLWHVESLLKIMGWEWRDYDDFMLRYGPKNNVKEWAAFNYNIMFWDEVGVVVKNGLIEPNYVKELMTPSVTMLWEKFEPIIRELRSKGGYPQFGQCTEQLYKMIK